MKQLEFDFNSINFSDYYVENQVIDEGKNQVFSWSDTLSDDGKKIRYHEYIYNTPNCMEFENWIEVENKWLNKSTFKKLQMYLKSLERHQDRLKKMKKCLEEKNIPFEEGDWQTIDKDCERKKLNQNKFYELFRNKKSYQN